MPAEPFAKHLFSASDREFKTAQHLTSIFAFLTPLQNPPRHSYRLDSIILHGEALQQVLKKKGDGSVEQPLLDFRTAFASAVLEAYCLALSLYHPT
jgi:hypothetical protein